MKRRAGAFGPPFGRPESLSLAWPLRRRSGANAEGGPAGAEGRMPGVRESNQREGHPSSAPSAPPCAEGPRESVGVFGQAIPGLSKTLAASLRPTLRAIRPPPAAPQVPQLLPARAEARASRRHRVGPGPPKARRLPRSTEIPVPPLPVQALHRLQGSESRSQMPSVKRTGFEDRGEHRAHGGPGPTLWRCACGLLPSLPAQA
jgi:hypothetical protein